MEGKKVKALLLIASCFVAEARRIQQLVSLKKHSDLSHSHDAAGSGEWQRGAEGKVTSAESHELSPMRTVQSMMISPKVQEQAQVFAEKLSSIAAADPGLLLEQDAVVGPQREAVLTDRTLQDHVSFAVDQGDAPEAQEQANRGSDILESMMQYSKTREEAKLVGEYFEAMKEDPKFEELAKLLFSQVDALATDPNLQEQVKHIASQVEAMTASPKFEEQSKVIDDLVNIILGADSLGKCMGTPESKLVKDDSKTMKDYASKALDNEQAATEINELDPAKPSSFIQMPDTEPASSKATRANSSLTKETKRKAEEQEPAMDPAKEEPAPEPVSPFSGVVRQLVMIQVMWIGNKVNWKDAQNLLILRSVSASVACLCMASLAFTYKCATRSESTERVQKPGTGQFLPKPGDPDRANDGSVSVSVYDAAMISEQFMQVLTSGALILVMHLQLKYNVPLLLWCVMQLQQLWDSKALHIHLLGASGPEYERPWKKGSGGNPLQEWLERQMEEPKEADASQTEGGKETHDLQEQLEAVTEEALKSKQALQQLERSYDAKICKLMSQVSELQEKMEKLQAD